jgi:hypothetical protein
MLIFILISVYILSIIGCKYVYLLQSSKYLDNFLDEDCTVQVTWFIPVVNTLAAILFLIFSLFHLIKKSKLAKNKFINWLCNFDLIKDKPF